MKNINLTFWFAAALSAPFAQAQKYVQCSKELYYFDGYKVGGTGISSVPVKISEVTINKFDDQTLVTDASGLNILEHSTYAIASTGPTPIVEHQVHRHRPTLKLNADEFANIIGMSDQASLGKKSYKYRVKGAQDDTFHFPRDIICQPANNSCALYIHLPLNWVAEVQGNQIQACRPNQTMTNYVPQAFAYSEVAPYLAEMGVKPAANGTMRVFNVDCASFVQGVGCFYDEPIDNADFSPKFLPGNAAALGAGEYAAERPLSSSCWLQVAESMEKNATYSLQKASLVFMGKPHRKGGQLLSEFGCLF